MLTTSTSSNAQPAKKQRLGHSPHASPEGISYHAPHPQISSVRASLFQSPGDGAQDNDSDVDEDTPIDTANSVYHAVADRSTFSIAGVMDRNGDAQENGQSSSPTHLDDPVSCGILSMDESESLFDQ